MLWLRQQPLLYREGDFLLGPMRDCCLAWTVEQAEELAGEAHNGDTGDQFLTTLRAPPQRFVCNGARPLEPGSGSHHHQSVDSFLSLLG